MVTTTGHAIKEGAGNAVICIRRFIVNQLDLEKVKRLPLAGGGRRCLEEVPQGTARASCRSAVARLEQRTVKKRSERLSHS